MAHPTYHCAEQEINALNRNGLQSDRTVRNRPRTASSRIRRKCPSTGFKSTNPLILVPPDHLGPIAALRPSNQSHRPSVPEPNLPAKICLGVPARRPTASKPATPCRRCQTRTNPTKSPRARACASYSQERAHLSYSQERETFYESFGPIILCRRTIHREQPSYQKETRRPVSPHSSQTLSSQRNTESAPFHATSISCRPTHFALSHRIARCHQPDSLSAARLPTATAS